MGLCFVRLALLWAGLMLCAAAVGATEIDAFDGSQLEVLEDPGAQLSLEEVRQRPASQWKRVAVPSPNFGYTRSAFWFRGELSNPTRGPQHRLLEVPAPRLDWLDIYVLRGDGNGPALNHWAFGDKLPFETRSILHRSFVVPLEWAPDSGIQLYLRMQNSGSAQLPTRLWTPESFERKRGIEMVAQGLYFGIMFAMFAYNLFLFASVRESSYLWYVLWVATLAAFIGSQSGLSFQFLWPHATSWNDTSTIFFLSLSWTFGSLFTRSFLNLAREAPRRARLLVGMAVLGVLSAVATLLLPYAPLVRFVNVVTIALAVMVLVVAAMRLRDGFVPARYFLMAWSFVLFGGMVFAFNRMGFLPTNVWTEHATQIGSGIEVLLLALALAARVNRDRRLREDAQAEAIRTHREANEQLDRRVRERTAELELANVRLREMSETDGLTGVHNRRHLDEALVIEGQRATRAAGPLGLIMIDIDNFKRINDHHGHAAGDECLKQVARTISALARRSSDIVARYGGEEFCALMPGVSLPEALEIAENMRAKIEQTILDASGKQLHLTASFGVCCRVPVSPQDAQLMLDAADAALYESKRLGRNCVSVAPGP